MLCIKQKLIIKIQIQLLSVIIKMGICLREQLHYPSSVTFVLSLFHGLNDVPDSMAEA